MDHTARFNGKSEIYAKSRPQYAPALLDYLKNTRGISASAVFADIGSGTGIFTRQLLHCGYTVFAVEPNSDMRMKAEEALSGDKNFRSVGGSSENTNLPDKSIDYIAAAQAFHWFDSQSFREECRRVLKPTGKVLLVYNVKQEIAPCVRALADLQRQYSPEFRGFSNGMNPEQCIAFFSGNCEIFRSENPQVYDRQSYVNYVLSSSCSLWEGDERYTEYLQKIQEIFDRFSDGSRITVPMETVAYIGSV